MIDLKKYYRISIGRVGLFAKFLGERYYSLFAVLGENNVMEVLIVKQPKLKPIVKNYKHLKSFEFLFIKVEIDIVW